MKSILCLGIKEENPSIVSCKVTVSYELQKFKEETIPYNKNCYNLGVWRVLWESPAENKLWETLWSKVGSVLTGEEQKVKEIMWAQKTLKTVTSVVG